MLIPGPGTCRWLWQSLDGPTAVKTTRLAVFGMLAGMWLGAYWAVATRGEMVRRFEAIGRMTERRDAQLAALDLTLARTADALVALRDLSDRQGGQIAQIAERVAHAEGRLNERGAR